MRALANRVVRAAYLAVFRLKRRTSGALDAVAPRAAEGLFRGGTRLAFVPFRGERNPLPEPIESGIRIDIVGDLEAYTRLPRATLERELVTRRDLSFRAEWHATPEDLRADHWYYLSSKGYLFANASHFTEPAFVERFVKPHVPPGGRVLDFGGGAGNLTMLLAGAGYDVSYFELGALQRDFVRFRVDRHGLRDRVSIIDWWGKAEPGSLDAVVAVDVLEHLDDCRSILEDHLLPALAPNGALIENTSFVVNVSNPMHHEDYGMDEHLRSAGMEVVETADDGTRIWRRTASAAGQKRAA